jgi:outer membrane protein assembly factor BamD (BamD/ComL family)
MLCPMIRQAVIAGMVLAAPALAQVQEFRLDAPGNLVAQPAAPMDADEQVIARARQALADGKAGQAKSILTPWIKEHAASTHRLLAAAYLLRGDARVADGNEFKALYDYEAVAKGFPATEEFRRAVERELEIGIKYVYGLNRIWLGFRWADATDIGEELLIRVQERLPGSDVAERAGIELADYYWRTRELKLASDAYEIFLANFPKSRYAERARQRRIYANIARFKGPDYDATGLADAQVLIRQFADADPAGAQRAGLSDALVARLDESAASQVLEKARWYLGRSDLVSARATLRKVIERHPQTVAAKTALGILQERNWAVERPRTTAAAPAPVGEARGGAP